MRFSEILEQDRVKSHLQNALRTGRVSHAYLFSGEEGMGKRMMARTFAQALLCERGREEGGDPSEPCGACPACVMAEAMTHPDLRMLSYEKSGYTVGDIRAQLLGDIGLMPMRGERRVYILPDADRMNLPAQNALLKTLEEPPGYAVILLLSARPQALLPTILSRTVELPLRPVRDETIAAYLMRAHRVPDYRARECAAFAGGNVGRAIRYAGDDGFRRLVEGTAKLLTELPGLVTADILERLGVLLSPPPGEDPKKDKERKKRPSVKEAGPEALSRLLDVMMLLNRDAMVWKATEETERLVFAEQVAYDREAAKKAWRVLSQEQRRIEEARERLRANVNADLTMELLLLGIKDGVRL